MLKINQNSHYQHKPLCKARYFLWKPAWWATSNHRWNISWIIPRCHSNNHIDKHAKSAFHVIGFTITQEVAHDEDRKDEQDHHEDLKVEVHFFTQSPANQDNQRCIEEGRLNGRSETVEESKVDLVIPASKTVSNSTTRSKRAWQGYNYQASSMAVKCSAAFSTRGTKIRPIKLSGTPRSTMNWICSTKKYAERETHVRETAMAIRLSKRVSFGR